MSNNILPLIDTDSWKTEMPEVKEIAEFTKEIGGLRIKLSSESFGMGKWVSETEIEGEKSYRLTA